MEPLVLEDESGKPVGKVKDGDAVIFCCRRGEREIQLTDAFVEQDFSHFNRKPIKNLDFVLLTLYHEKFQGMPVAFAPKSVEKPLAQCVSEAGKRQLHLAESEKFAHVTYFFNGGSNTIFDGEDDWLVPSPKGVSFDKVPELSLTQVSNKLKQGIDMGYDMIVANFANGDVIGHTSNTESKVECAGYVDRHLCECVETALANDYVVAITADHGNLEVAYTDSGESHVAHTSNLVPFFVIDPLSDKNVQPKDGGLSGIAPTILQILNIPKPKNMTGESLVPDHNFGTGRKCMLIILDGWGIGAPDESNPIFMADTPYLDNLSVNYPMGMLQASGEAVGLQKGKAGNSEAGHLGIGAGRVVVQDDVRLDAAMKDGTFGENAVFLDTISGVKARDGVLHLLSLLTQKSSHGSIDYPLEIVKIAAKEGLEKVYIHVIFDGRSTDPKSAPYLLQELENKLDNIGVGTIVDGIGRGIALDRDKNFSKTQKAYECIVLGRGKRYH